MEGETLCCRFGTLRATQFSRSFRHSFRLYANLVFEIQGTSSTFPRVFNTPSITLYLLHVRDSKQAAPHMSFARRIGFKTRPHEPADCQTQRYVYSKVHALFSLHGSCAQTATSTLLRIQTSYLCCDCVGKKGGRLGREGEWE